MILLGVGVEIAEGGGETVAAMLLRRAAERPQGVLQAFGERDEALAAEHDMGGFEARERQAEVIEPVIERNAGDANAEIAHVAKVREPHAARRMLLPEDHLLLGTMEGAPVPDAPLQRAAHAGVELRMPAAQLLEHADRPQAGRRFQHGDDLAVPDAFERIWPPAGARRLLLRGKPWVLLQAIGGRRAEPGFRRGDGGGIGFSKLHEEPHLAVGDMAAGQRIGPPTGKTDPSPGPATGRQAVFSARAGVSA